MWWRFQWCCGRTDWRHYDRSFDESLLRCDEADDENTVEGGAGRGERNAFCRDSRHLKTDTRRHMGDTAGMVMPPRKPVSVFSHAFGSAAGATTATS
mmetsp:Transcript_50835/g.135693  ORF Transcript_50835/g.135693 Transcript_50835/m.135693 type:complete len:97 (-) Transcript_50835:110-400(-)